MAHSTLIVLCITIATLSCIFVSGDDSQQVNAGNPESITNIGGVTQVSSTANVHGEKQVAQGVDNVAHKGHSDEDDDTDDEYVHIFSRYPYMDPELYEEMDMYD